MFNALLLPADILIWMYSGWTARSPPTLNGHTGSNDDKYANVKTSSTSQEQTWLAAAADLALIPALHYAYDPLPAQARQARQLALHYNERPSATGSFISHNSIGLSPWAAGLPFRSSLPEVRASRHWQDNLGETLQLLQLLALEKSASDIEVKGGITLRKLADAALRPGFEDQMMLAAHYMFPAADGERMRLIAALTVMYFVFDDKVEETPNDQLRIFRNDFLHRLQGKTESKASDSAFQQYMDSVIQRIRKIDAAGGNGGMEMVDSLRGAFTHVHPNINDLQSVPEYLEFRRQNVGASFVIAAIKFSIQSSIPTTATTKNTTNNRHTKLLNLFADHLGIVNDLASYDKELRALQRGEASDMINIVDVIKRVTGVRDTDDAKAVVWSLQLQIERDMLAEVEYLKSKWNASSAGMKGDRENEEEDWFLDAVLLCAAGHVMFCMTTSRYGGEDAKIKAT